MRAYCSGSWRAQPQELRGREARERPVARQLDEAVEADALADLLALARGALVVPEDRGADHLLVGVEHDEPVHLPDQADPRDVAGVELGQRLLRRPPPRLGILLGPAGPGVDSG
jgi:hypothetical protein